MNDIPNREPSGALESDSRADEVSLPWILAVLLRSRGLIAGITILGLVLALVLAVMKPTTYTSTFSFLPQSGEDPSRAGLASLAGQFGLSLGGRGSGQAPQLYADLLTTHAVLAAIAKDSVIDAAQGGKRVPLAEFLKVDASDPAVALENTVRALRLRVVSTSVATQTTGVVTVNARTRSAQASLEIAQKLLDGLNRFNVATRRSQASQERKFTEGRLEAAKTALRAAEDALQHFLQSNRQYKGSPELVFQEERLQREVTLQQQIVTGLSQQYEDARIREVRDTPVITVLDQPILPVFHDPRGRALLVIVVTLLALFFGAAIAVAKAGWRRQRESGTDPAYSMLSSEWQNVRGRLRTKG